MPTYSHKESIAVYVSSLIREGSSYVRLCEAAGVVSSSRVNALLMGPVQKKGFDP